MASTPFTLAGKTVLVTGASGGIGRATALECARMGATVILTGRNEERLKECMNSLPEGEHQYLCADLTHENDVQTLVESLPELDGVTDCAGISMLRPLQTIREADLQHVFAVNCFAPMLLLKWLIKKCKLRQGASVVFVSSISGNGNTALGLSTYGASKAAVSSFVKYAALELAARGVRVNAVLPGRIETALLQNQSMTDEDVQRDKLKYPLRRYGRPEEVAYSIIYLLSDVSQWITGVNLPIDGGRSLI